VGLSPAGGTGFSLCQASSAPKGGVGRGCNVARNIPRLKPGFGPVEIGFGFLILLKTKDRLGFEWYFSVSHGEENSVFKELGR
jgi:hypothetical protein